MEDMNEKRIHDLHFRGRPGQILLHASALGVLFDAELWGSPRCRKPKDAKRKPGRLESA